VIEGFCWICGAKWEGPHVAECITVNISRAEAAEARVAELEGALVELDDVHSRLIAAVTPGHIGWIKGPSEEYTGLFSEWHRATRKCRSLVGPAPDPKERT